MEVEALFRVRILYKNEALVSFYFMIFFGLVVFFCY
jgi:hypothetical protein